MTGNERKDWIVRELIADGIRYVDKRDKGGALWVPESSRAKTTVLRLVRNYDVKFSFSKNGGRTTSYRPA